MGPTWGRQVTGGSHVGPIYFATWVGYWSWHERNHESSTLLVLYEENTTMTVGSSLQWANNALNFPCHGKYMGVSPFSFHLTLVPMKFTPTFQGYLWTLNNHKLLQCLGTKAWRLLENALSQSTKIVTILAIHRKQALVLVDIFHLLCVVLGIPRNDTWYKPASGE